MAYESDLYHEDKIGEELAAQLQRGRRLSLSSVPVRSRKVHITDRSLDAKTVITFPRITCVTYSFRTAKAGMREIRKSVVMLNPPMKLYCRPCRASVVRLSV